MLKCFVEPRRTAEFDNNFPCAHCGSWGSECKVGHPLSGKWAGRSASLKVLQLSYQSVLGYDAEAQRAPYGSVNAPVANVQG